MNEIKSSLPFFPFNKAKLVPKKWGKREFYSAFLWQQTASLPLVGLRMFDNFKKLLYCFYPGYIKHRVTTSGLSSVYSSQRYRTVTAVVTQLRILSTYPTFSAAFRNSKCTENKVI